MSLCDGKRAYELISASLNRCGEQGNAKPLAFAISWTHSPVAKNPGFALRQFRHDGEFRLMKFRKCLRSFAYASSVAAVSVLSTQSTGVVHIMHRAEVYKPQDIDNKKENIY